MATEQLTAAQKLQQEHEGHHVTVEDVVDEDLKPHRDSIEPTDGSAPVLSEKAAGKQKASAAPATLDTQSRELFPELGGPKPQLNTTKPKWNVSKSTATNGHTSTPAPAANGSGAATPSSGLATPTGKPAAPSVVLPGRNVRTYTLAPEHVKPRDQLKRPMNQIIQDVNRGSRAQVKVLPGVNGQGLRLEAVGPEDAAVKALNQLVKEFGATTTIDVPIPQSLRAHIIGRQGSTIKALQEQTGARIEVPKEDKNTAAGGASADDDLDDEDYINVKVEGNSLSAARARDLINAIVSERAAKVNTRVKDIPAEFYPFIANSKGGILGSLTDDSPARLRIPPHRDWSSQVTTPVPAPGQRPAFQPAQDHHLRLEGERQAVLALKQEIQRRAAELERELLLRQLEIQRGRHQFIIGRSGLSPDEFFEQTGCAIILPTDEDDDAITIVGPESRINDAIAKAEELSQSMNLNNVDHLKWTNKQAPGRAAAHSSNVTRYLRQRDEIKRLEEQYRAHINTPFSQDGALPWELYLPQGQSFTKASSDIRSVFESHPPSRMRTIDVDPFFHPYMQKEVGRQVRDNYGVHLVVPGPSEAGVPLLLVFEGPRSAGGSPYEIPRTVPSQADIQAFEQGLRDAEKHISDLLAQQDKIVSIEMDIPTKFHPRLIKFITHELDKTKSNQVRTRVKNVGSKVTLRGPETVTQALAEKVRAFVEQEKADEKERDFTLEFDFPQQYANHLIGKGGSRIKELRDKFDVEIQVENGKVQLKGPKAKASAARSHIESLGKELADETSRRLTVDPKFHGELIGSKGKEIDKLQNRYNVMIFFPRAEKNGNKQEEAAEETGNKARRQQAPDEVLIRGPSKGVSSAYDELKSFYDYLKENSYTTTVTVQRKQLPSLIGSGGTAMEALRAQTECKIDMPPNDKESNEPQVEITIKGKKANVEKAKKILEGKKAVFDDTVVKTIDVERKYHKALIGQGGSHLRDMVNKAGGPDDIRERARLIQFPKQEAEGNTIKLEGRTETVNNLIKQIEEFVALRDSQVTISVEVPTDKHRSLIGRGGETKKKLETQFSVAIDIPRQGSTETAIKITGQEAEVEKAKQHIVNLTKEKPSETVQVPRNLHQAISNNGQFFRKMRNDFNVTVDHAGQNPPPKTAAAPRANGGENLPLITDAPEEDTHSWNVVSSVSTEEGEIPWVLKGSPENIEKAKKAIMAALDQAQANVTGYLVLPDPKTYRHVIGQGGSKVNSIRKQSGCKINVPRDNGDAIEVIGTAEGVEKAKDLILAAVRDGVNGSRAREQ